MGLPSPPLKVFIHLWHYALTFDNMHQSMHQCRYWQHAGWLPSHTATVRKRGALCPAVLCSFALLSLWMVVVVFGGGLFRFRLAVSNGTQCGYCSCGFVMNMVCFLSLFALFSFMYEQYGLLMKSPQPSQSVIENRFDGNICRWEWCGLCLIYICEKVYRLPFDIQSNASVCCSYLICLICLLYPIYHICVRTVVFLR